VAEDFARCGFESLATRALKATLLMGGRTALVDCSLSSVNDLLTPDF
jgi:hypothetical protein